VPASVGLDRGWLVPDLYRRLNLVGLLRQTARGLVRHPVDVAQPDRYLSEDI